MWLSTISIVYGGINPFKQNCTIAEQQTCTIEKVLDPTILRG